MPLTRIQSSLVSTVANTSISGNIIASQISSVSNTAITGNIIASQVQPTGVTAARYGNATIIPAITIGPDGRVTSASNVAIGVSAAAQDFIILATGII